MLHTVAQPIFVSEVYITYQDEVLMFKRSEKKKKFPGFWSIPGGHIEAGEDPMASAIREIKEETNITLKPENIKLKVVAMHHHLDREEMFVAFAYEATIPKKITPKPKDAEGSAHWMKKSEAMELENVFAPIKYYFDHVMNNKPGIIYNMSEWKNLELVKVLSETVDTNS